MDSERWQQVQELFSQALQVDPAERLGFLDQACGGDEELLAEVKALVAHDDLAQARGFLPDIPEDITSHVTQPPNLTGTTVSAYELREELGRGGWGVVYKAWQISLQRLVAVKVILHDDFASETDRERFANEARVLARLAHPHIVQVFDFGEHLGKPFFSMELLEGGSLAQKLAQAPFAPEVAAALIETLARTLEQVHQVGIVHRDLKPSNVLLTAEGIAKITDFGLSKTSTEDSHRTATGTILGTPSYMAPEQAAGDRSKVGPTADVYALGAILYEAVTGRPPFRAPTPWETIQQVLHQEPIPPRRLQPSLARDISTICLKCLEKDPHRRYPSARALAEDLRRFLDGKPISARPVSIPERLYRWGRRNPVVAALSGALATALVCGLLATSFLWIRTRTQRNRAETSLTRVFKVVDEALREATTPEMRDAEDLKPFRRSLQEKALNQLQDLAKELGTTPRLERELAKSYILMCDIEHQLGHPEKAVEAARIGIALLERLPAQGGNEARGDLAFALQKLSLDLPSGAEQAQVVDRAITLFTELLREDPASEFARQNLAMLFYNQAVDAGNSSKNQPQEVISLAEKASEVLGPCKDKSPDLDAHIHRFLCASAGCKPEHGGSPAWKSCPGNSLASSRRQSLGQHE